MVEYMLLILLGFGALGVVCWQMTAGMRRKGSRQDQQTDHLFGAAWCWGWY